MLLGFSKMKLNLRILWSVKCATKTHIKGVLKMKNTFCGIEIYKEIENCGYPYIVAEFCIDELKEFNNTECKIEITNDGDIDIFVEDANDYKMFVLAYRGNLFDLIGFRKAFLDRHYLSLSYIIV